MTHCSAALSLIFFLEGSKLTLQNWFRIALATSGLWISLDQSLKGTVGKISPKMSQVSRCLGKSVAAFIGDISEHGPDASHFAGMTTTTACQVGVEGFELLPLPLVLQESHLNGGPQLSCLKRFDLLKIFEAQQTWHSLDIHLALVSLEENLVMINFSHVWDPDIAGRTNGDQNPGCLRAGDLNLDHSASRGVAQCWAQDPCSELALQQGDGRVWKHYRLASMPQEKEHETKWSTSLNLRLWQSYAIIATYCYNWHTPGTDMAWQKETRDWLLTHKQYPTIGWHMLALASQRQTTGSLSRKIS